MSVFTERGITVQCSDCYATVAQPEPAARAEQPRVTAERKRSAAPTTKAPATAGFDVIKAAKARLREIDRELRRLRKLEAEATKLRRLLSAAERPLADVKPLRAKA